MVRQVLVGALAVMVSGCGEELAEQGGFPAAQAAEAVASAVTAPDEPAAPVEQQASPAVPASLQLRTTDNVESAVWKTRFSIDDTYDVYFAIDLPEAPPAGAQVAVEVLMPDGSPYQALTVDAAQLEPTDHGVRLWASVPVAGTLIQNVYLAGTWKAQALVNAQPQAEALFELY